ncbi:MAG: hypothetical protein QOE23_2432 [Pseudonocardiales bacterium]|jgi:hypothetical protein|nr:hypothetical protein [Pseudonocardiales bacterium]
MTAITPDSAKSCEPYVGPRPFRQGELFYGREPEAAALVNTLVAGRIVLLHSPSGAGKTSLIQAAITPAMVERDFQICAQLKPFSAARVTTPVPEGVKAENGYVASVVTCLLGHLPDFPGKHDWTISQALERLHEEQGAPRQQLLLLDQFEEILTTDSTDFDGQRGFFRQLGEALDNRDRWALLAMREDFMGGLDRFLRYIPGQLRSTFRLDLLDKDGAMRAIQLPAKECGVKFTDPAAAKLIADLQLVRTGGVRNGHLRLGTYVEPVLLQVVCDSLWRKLSGNSIPFTEIGAGDVEDFGPLDAALGVYYNKVVAEASQGNLAAEREIRDWIQTQLLTRDGLRSQTRSQPDVSEPDKVLAMLQEHYLIRSDPRPNAIWWELSHDRLSEAILDDNRAWREKLEPWQRAAYEWQRSHHDDRYLIDGEPLRAARASRRKGLRLTALDREFLARSEERVASEGRLERTRARINLLLVALALSLIVNLLLAVLYISRWLAKVAILRQRSEPHELPTLWAHRPVHKPGAVPLPRKRTGRTTQRCRST